MTLRIHHLDLYGELLTVLVEIECVLNPTSLFYLFQRIQPGKVCLFVPFLIDL